MQASAHTFPKDFLWGVATSALQIEGAACEVGRGESIWDRFAARRGAIADGSNASVACDHYHRWREDVELLRSLGVNAYRLSIAWPRVMPEGTGAVNAAGLDFYDALVDALLDAGIRPFVTLNHWDLPQSLQETGGWESRACVQAFVDYAAAVALRLGDRVHHWATHNEPWCIASLGYETGEHAPGFRDPAASLRVAHHLLLSHGRAIRAVRALTPGAEWGIVLVLSPVHPALPRDSDREAARRVDARLNRWYLDPLFHGRYPSDAIEDRVRLGHITLVDHLPDFVQPRDMEDIATPIDFLGVNYYTRVVIRSDHGEPVAVPAAPPTDVTDMGWEVYPEGLWQVLEGVHQEYTPARIYVTENGAAFTDRRDRRDRIADTRRIDYLQRHLLEVRHAIDAGVPVGGYFVWSLLDNFEWAHGYTKKFGLYEVDFATQRRTPRDSASWYRDTISAHAVLPAVPQIQ